jgi:excisionase family DNA binding protein
VSNLAVSLTVEELRALVREEVATVVDAKLGQKTEASDVLTRKDAAKLLGVNAHSIPRLIKHGLPSHPFGKRGWRFLRSELVQWMTTQPQRKDG